MHAEHLLVDFTKRRAVIGGQSREGFTLLHTEGVQREGFFKGWVQEIRVSADRRDGGQAIGQIKCIGFVQGEQKGQGSGRVIGDFVGGVDQFAPLLLTSHHVVHHFHGVDVIVHFTSTHAHADHVGHAHARFTVIGQLFERRKNALLPRFKRGAEGGWIFGGPVVLGGQCSQIDLPTFA